MVFTLLNHHNSSLDFRTRVSTTTVFQVFVQEGNTPHRCPVYVRSGSLTTLLPKSQEVRDGGWVEGTGGREHVKRIESFTGVTGRTVVQSLNSQ